MQSTQRRNLPDSELEALLDAAENEETAAVVDTTPVQDEVVIFLKHYDINPGEHPVSARILHSVYKLWSKEPKNYHVFKASLSLVLKESDFKEHFDLDKDLKNVWEKMELVKRRKRRRGHMSTRTQQKVDNFFNERSVKPGKFWVDVERVYDLYVSWSGRKNLGLKRFKELCWGKFEKKRTYDDKEWLRLDESIKAYIQRNDEEKKEVN